MTSCLVICHLVRNNSLQLSPKIGFHAKLYTIIKVIKAVNTTIGGELVVLHTTPSMFVKFMVHSKNILYQFIEGQTHFGMPRGAKVSLALNEPK